MGIERASVSTKLDAEDEEFIYEWAKQLKPHEVSQSSLTGLCVRIVRIQAHAGKINLEPKALQAFLRNLENGSNAGNVALPERTWTVEQTRKAMGKK